MTQTLSEKIKDCRQGVVRNPYQGADKRVLFVCTMGLLRSATGARIYGHRLNTRTAGIDNDALVPVTPTLLAWADEIVFVHPMTHAAAEEKYGNDAWPHARTVVLFIDDKWPHMDPELIAQFERQYGPRNLET